MLKRILYAEDNDALREMSVRGLRGAGYFVLPVADGLAALEASRDRPFDLLITDNDMPRLTGVELIARLRLAGCEMPAIVTSGGTNHFAADEYDWLRLSAWVQKPFAMRELITLISGLVTERAVPEAPDLSSACRRQHLLAPCL